MLMTRKPTWPINWSQVNWRDKYKRAEQDYMVLKDEYAEVARALGFEGDAWFGDPLASHAEVVERARELAAKQGEAA